MTFEILRGILVTLVMIGTFAAIYLLLDDPNRGRGLL